MTCPSCGAGNPPDARFCSSCGTALSSGPRPVEGERKYATVLFADVAHSTALAERLDPEDWAAIMNGAFGFMNTAVGRYGGTVGRLMGDAILAFFGAPVAQEDHAERAVLAGLRIRQSAREYAATLRPRFGIDFEVRVGINTGWSILGRVGDTLMTEYTAMGDTANVAARLQSAARPGGVVIGPETRRLVRDRFELREMGAVELKGKEALVEVWEVLASRGGPGVGRGIEGLSSPLVGRQAECAALRARMSALAGGSGSVVLVEGEAGIGKSRLLAEVRRFAAGDGAGAGDGGAARDGAAAGDRATASDGRPPAFAWLEGRGVSYVQSVAYYPWRQVGRQVIGATESDAPAEVRNKLRAAATRWRLAADDLPLLETLLTVESEESRLALADADGPELVQRIGAVVRQALRAEIRAGATPHVLVFDDLHWTDPASLELLVQVAELTRSEPLLVICLLRPDRHAPSRTLAESLRAAIDGDRLLELRLEPLDPQHAAELLANLLHVEDLPERTRALLLRRSEGNPFFLEEVLRSLIDAGVVVRENGSWRATAAIDELAIPETLEGILSARIDRLPDATKRVTQTAAVLGRIFRHRPLIRICELAPPPERVDDVDPHLDTLTDEELLRERAREPEREYIFKHALTQEAAYGLLLRARRRELHARAGSVLEELYPERVEELAPVLARHFYEGEDYERAVEHGMRAAARAIRLFALGEALEEYEGVLAAVDRWPDAPARTVIDAILGWTLARHKRNEYEGVIERLERAEELARATDDRGRLAGALSWIGNVHMLTGTPSRAMPFLLESQQLATELGDERLVLLPHFMATDAMADRDPAEAAGRLEGIIEQARRFRVPEIEAHAMGSLAMVLARLGRFDESERMIAAALEAAPKSGSPVKEADVHITVGFAYHEMEQFEKGLEHSRRGAELAQATNAVECACAAHFGVGMNSLARRELDAALGGFRRSLQFADLSGWGDWVNRIRAGAAAAELEGGRAGSVADLEAALRNARSGHDEFAEATLSQMLAHAYLATGAPERAGASLETALAFYRKVGMKPAQARALELAARVAEAAGDAEEARAHREAAAALRATFRAPRAAEPPVSLPRPEPRTHEPRSHGPRSHEPRAHAPRSPDPAASPAGPEIPNAEPEGGPDAATL